MGSSNGKRKLGAQVSINKHLDKLSYGAPKQAKNWVHCRAPSCNKLVEHQYTRKGYCLACVNRAAKAKAEREHMARIERDAMKCYDDDNYGLF